MNPRRQLLSVLTVVLLGACGQTTDDSATAEPSGDETDAASRAASTETALLASTSFGELPVPRTGDDAVTMLDAMPEEVDDWVAETSDPGQALYKHPAGLLGIEAAELSDIYARPVTAAEGVRMFRRDLDGRRGEPCASPPARCLTGHLEGDAAVVWTHDDSEVLLVGVWPDEVAGKRLLDAWTAQSNS